LERPKNLGRRASHAEQIPERFNPSTLEDAVSTLPAVALIDKTYQWTKYWGKMDAAWAFVFGVAVFIIPDIGPLIIAAPLLAAWMIASLHTRRGDGETG